MQPISGGRIFTRRRFLGGLAAAGVAAAAAGAWLTRRPEPTASMPSANVIAADVRAELLRAWNAYKTLAWGHDELRPVSGSFQEFFAPGSPVGLTIIESLDTLYLMELDDELDRGVRWIEANLNLDIDARFQVFETVIRVLGGLLAGHLATNNAALLAKSKELADRLLPAFTKSPTGMPYRYVNLHSGEVSEPANFIAEIGTNVVELGTLSKLTGDRRYLDVAKKALKAVFDRRSTLDLIATTINVETGTWLNRVSVGPQPPVDSFYEYLLDGYNLFGDAELLSWFKTMTAALQMHQWDRQFGQFWYQPVEFQTGALINYEESELAAFWAGNLAEAGMQKEADQFLDSFKSALDRYEIFPEQWDYSDMSIRDPSHQLRPEYADACLAMFVTSGGSQRYRERAYQLYQAMKKNCRVPNGYSIIKDITTRPMTLGDLTPAYWFSENMKYYYLLFSSTPRFDYRNNYLSTEGKVLTGLKHA
jgi:mannosyl-oligosaccharide alpha-1,2-mannosidase